MLEVSSWVTTNIEWGLRVAAGNRWNVCHRNMEGTSSSQLCATLDEAGRANGYHADGDTTTFSERSAISPGLRRPASAVQTYKCLNARCRNDGILLGCARGRPERTHQHRMHVRIRLGLRCFEVQVRVTVQPSARSGRRPMIIMIQMISFRTFFSFLFIYLGNFTCTFFLVYWTLVALLCIWV